jgi:hypothetical protein
MMAGAALAALPLPLAAQVGGMAVLGLGTALVWADLHHRMLTVVPGRSASVPTVVGVLSTPALFVPAGMGILADRVSVTASLVATAALTVPLAIIVVRLARGS